MKIIELDDPLYPKHLSEIHDPPKELFCIGNTDLLKIPGIAIVGTRRSSPYGRWAAYEIAKKIAECDITVISGMAEGIDSQGHLGCLAQDGKTIAVLGTGIDICYPKSNKELYKTIAEKGLIISEYPPGEKGHSYYFPQRNRIISGLSKSVIVVEGAMKSGSMITANLAASQGREVYAVPGNINQPNSVGVNSLIRDGAIPILSVDGVVETLGIGKAKYTKIVKSCSKEELDILNYIEYNPGSDIDLISLYCDLLPSEASMIACALELKGLIRKEDNRFYII